MRLNGLLKNSAKMDINQQIKIWMRNSSNRKLADGSGKGYKLRSTESETVILTLRLTFIILLNLIIYI